MKTPFHSVCYFSCVVSFRRFLLQSLISYLYEWYSGRSQLSEEDQRKVQDKVLGEVDKWMERFDCLVIGPGLGRDPFLLVQIHLVLLHHITEFDLSLLWWWTYKL